MHTLIDTAAQKIVEIAKRQGATVSGPIPLPTEKEIITILRAVHKYKDSREQFEYRTHKRLIDIIKPSKAVVEAIAATELPAGVEIEIKLEYQAFAIKALQNSPNCREAALSVMLAQPEREIPKRQPITYRRRKNEKSNHRQEAGYDTDL